MSTETGLLLLVLILIMIGGCLNIVPLLAIAVVLLVTAIITMIVTTRYIKSSEHKCPRGIT